MKFERLKRLPITICAVYGRSSKGTLDSVLASGERFDFVVAQPATLPFSPGFPATGRHDPDDDGTLPLRRILEDAGIAVE